MHAKFLVGTILIAAAACGGPERYLMWRAAPAAAAVSGKLAIEVHDKRDPKKGGDDTRAVGLGTGFGGIPQVIRLKSHAAAAEQIHDYLGQAALASGLALAAPGDAAPSGKAVVEIQTLWCSGYEFVFKADVTLSVMFVDPATNAALTSAVPFHTDDGDSNCREAYRKALSKGFDAASALFAQGKAAAPAQ